MSLYKLLQNLILTFLIVFIKINSQDLVPLSGLELNPYIHVNKKIYGYVKLDTFFDTNQVIAAREDHTLIAPEPVILDALGRNINDRGQFGMTAVQSRIGILLNSNNWNCSELKAFANIEGDFLGTTELTIGSFRMRHAYGKIIKPNDYSILFGQYWSPLFILECYPHTLGFDNGSTFDAQARNPQLKLTKHFGSLEIILAALAQQQFTSNGPIGYTSEYQRNSITPNFHAQIRKHWGLNLLGAAIDYKRLVPRIVTNKCYKTNSSVNSIIAEIYSRIVYNSLFVRSKLIYTENGTEQILLGGYGVTSIDPITDTRNYQNTTAISAWIDCSKLLGQNIEIGGFVGGISKIDSQQPFYINPKTNKPIIYDLDERLTRAKYLFKFAPRIIWAYDPIRFGFEISYNRAGYGKFSNKHNELTNLVPANNVRFLGVAYYLF